MTFAPFVSMLVALALIPVAYPEWLETLLNRLGATLVALALVSVGYQLRLSEISERAKVLCLGLGFKLLLGPLVSLLVYAGLLGLRGPIIQVSIFEAAMGPMIGAAIVAMDHDLDPSLVTLMVGLGIMDSSSYLLPPASPATAVPASRATRNASVIELDIGGVQLRLRGPVDETSLCSVLRALRNSP